MPEPTKIIQLRAEPELPPTDERLTATGYLTLESNTGPRRYEAVFIEAGENKNGWTMPVEVLSAALPMFAGVPCLLNHPGWFTGPDVTKWAATHEEPILAGSAVKTTLRIENTDAGRALQDIFDAWLADKAAGLPVAPIGISAGLTVRWKPRDNAEDARVCERIVRVWSGDCVLYPAAGGRVERVLNSLSGGTSMPEELTPQPVQATPTAPPAPAPVATQPEHDPALDALSQQVLALTAQVQQLLNVATRQAEDEAVQGNAQPAVRHMMASMDQVQLAAEALLSGIRPPAGVRPLSGIRELYTLLSGDFEMTGMFRSDNVYLATVTSSTMANLVANVLNKLVMNQYQMYERWWEPAVSERDFNSLQQVRWITLGGVGELPTVAEGAPYTEMTWDDLAQRSNFAKKGGYLGITLESIDKDDTQRAQSAPQALAQSAWMTLGKAISAIFTANSGVGPNIYYDDSNTRALFHATNGNLGSTALSVDSWKATKVAMYKLTEVNSGERLAGLLRPKLLWVPVDLEDTAMEILASEGKVGTADNDINVNAEGDGRSERLRRARARVITCPFWTDTDNWAAQADPQLYPSIGVGYRFGRTPEIFSVASPTAGLMFTNDTMPIKVRFFFATGPVDYRGLYKHNV